MGFTGLSQETAINILKIPSRINLFLALSRTPHALLDMISPGLSALLCLGAFPSLPVTLLGIFTAFAGYTCVYALNDVIDFRNDREKVEPAAPKSAGKDLDAVMVRHPLAQGLLSFPEGVLWSVFWGGTAMAGAYLLNPVCLVIFLAACLLETVYCLMWRITPFRSIVSGVVKTAGSIAAVFAVDPKPSIGFLAAVFAFFFLWEIGGQNIPNDWADMDQDRRFLAKTVPLQFGQERSSFLILATLMAAVPASALPFLLSPLLFGTPYYVALIASGCVLMVYPALRL
ncbi:MAG: ubiquinone biosynthesis protein UbiA, partial [Deltaproteobacteria bacterium RBG_13_49_15]